MCKICYTQTQFDLTQLEKNQIDLSRLHNDLDNLLYIFFFFSGADNVTYFCLNCRKFRMGLVCTWYTARLAGVGFLRRGSQSTPHQGQPAPSPLARVCGERCQLPQRGPGRSPGSQAVFSERICCRPSVCRMSSVGNARAPYSGDCNFGNITTALGTLATFLKISGRSSQGNPCAGGVEHKRGSKI